MKRILIIEDEKPLAKVLGLKLIRNGYQVTTVENGEQGLHELDTHKFDLLILDIMTHKVGGFAVLEEMSAKNINVPVIVVSNLSQHEDIKKAKSLGVKDYYVKADISLESLVKNINKLFSSP